MGFLPANTVLGTTDEFKNISYTITYEVTTAGSIGVPGVTTTYPVTLTAIDPNTTINVSGNRILGYYSESFTNNIQYRTINDNFINVQKFEQIKKYDLSEIIYYKADTSRSKDYHYLATANGQTQTYTITVMNNWNTGRDNLISYVNISQYKVHTVTWINRYNATVTWVNNSGLEVNWISKI